MATIAVLADPPVEGVVLPEVVESTPLSADQARHLYEAMLVDISTAIQNGGADLLVNYRPEDEISVEGDARAELDDADSETLLREVLDEELGAPEEARYEVQVGETFAGRVGNTVTHLLEQEGEGSVGVVRPTAPFLDRQQIGAAAMKMRSSDVVLGPTTDGRVYYAGFSASLDFENAYATPAVETLTDRATDADLEVDFLPMLPVVEMPADLAETVTRIRSRVQAGRKVPYETATAVDELGLYADAGADGLTVAQTSDSS